MTRKTARDIAMRLVYEIDFNSERVSDVIKFRLSDEGFLSLANEDDAYISVPEKNEKDYILKVVSGVYEHLPEIDSYIEKYAVGWKFNRISRVALAILRVCMFEIIYMPDIPEKAAINEAVELAKRYEDEDIPPFVNGVLGSFSRAEGIRE